MRQNETIMVTYDPPGCSWECNVCRSSGLRWPTRMAARLARRHNRRVHAGELHVWGQGCADRRGDEVEWEPAGSPEETQ